MPGPCVINDNMEFGRILYNNFHKIVRNAMSLLTVTMCKLGVLSFDLIANVARIIPASRITFRLHKVKVKESSLIFRILCHASNNYTMSVSRRFSLTCHVLFQIKQLLFSNCCCYIVKFIRRKHPKRWENHRLKIASPNYD